jgi:hypothetical protein
MDKFQFAQYMDQKTWTVHHLHTFLTSALDEEQWFTSQSSPPGRKPGTLEQEDG